MEEEHTAAYHVLAISMGGVLGFLFVIVYLLGRIVVLLGGLV